MVIFSHDSFMIFLDIDVKLIPKKEIKLIFNLQFHKKKCLIVKYINMSRFIKTHFNWNIFSIAIVITFNTFKNN